MTLSKHDILKVCENKPLIEPFNGEHIQTCSYDLTFSGEYRMYDSKKICQENKALKEGDKLIIPADAICFVLTNETVNIPNNLTASISLSMGLIKSGVMLAAQPPYDAGYSGKTVALLHNLSNENVEIEVGQHILNIVFDELKTEVTEDDLYKGKYQGADNLSKFGVKTLEGGVFKLSRDFEKQKKKFESAIPNLLTMVTIILTILTLFITFSNPIVKIIELISTEKDTDNPTDTYDDNEIVFTVPSSGETDEIIIYVNNESYIINFEERSVTENIPSSTGEVDEK